MRVLRVGGDLAKTASVRATGVDSLGLGELYNAPIIKQTSG